MERAPDSSAGWSAAGVRWDTEHLARDITELDSLIAKMGIDCRDFSERYRGRLAALDAARLAAMLRELGGLRARLLWMDSVTALGLAADLSAEIARNQRAAVEAALDAADDLLRFVELEWIAVDDEAAHALCASRELASYRHFLLSTRRLSAHYLSEAEESVLAACQPAAELAWEVLYDRLRAELPLEADGRRAGVEEALASLRSPDRGQRMAALEGLGRALEPAAWLFAHGYDTVVANRLAVNSLRGFTGPREPRDRVNELPPAVVDAMLDAVDGAADLPQSWFASKAAFLGLSSLHLADERAPLPGSSGMSYSEAAAGVAQALAGSFGELAELVQELISTGLVDAEPRAGKQSYAFCRSLTYGGPPYVLLSYRDRVDDALRLAHELGHALHFTLAGRAQPPLCVDCPIVLREVPSTFTELLFSEWLIEHEAPPASRRALTVKRLESGLEAVFLSAALTRFEERAHALRAAGEVLLPERLGEVWLEASASYYGPGVQRPASQRVHWALVPHLLHEPFYSYAYTFAHLACLGLLRAFRQDGEGFAHRYVRFLSRGGSAGPVEQLQELGFDPTEADQWRMALGEMRRMLDSVRGF